ncbi:hypothetical protein [Ralstonia solanacearum]|uniref:hypothetical protein n=1 Tax=Ralstonia solanacearum TaxID=305 RepID=UPI000AFF0481|nr:hypothetical protein [Ralstonia solanacearum]
MSALTFFFLIKKKILNLLFGGGGGEKKKKNILFIIRPPQQLKETYIQYMLDLYNNKVVMEKYCLDNKHVDININ